MWQPLALLSFLFRPTHESAQRGECFHLFLFTDVPPGQERGITVGILYMFEAWEKKRMRVRGKGETEILLISLEAGVLQSRQESLGDDQGGDTKLQILLCKYACKFTSSENNLLGPMLAKVGRSFP